MKMTGEQKITAPRQAVWEGLNDPAMLRQCIPGCQSLEKEADGRLLGVVAIKIGPIGARFSGAVTLSELDPPNSYTITGEGQGGTVGSAKGGAQVRLVDDGAGTLLSYEVEAQVGGRLAQLGGPIIDATAKQLAGKFFEQFSNLLGGPVPQAATAPQSAAPAASAPIYSPAGVSPASRGFPAAWVLAVAVAALAGFLVHGGSGQNDWMGLAIGLLLMAVAAVSFEHGRKTAAPVLMLDAAALSRLGLDGRR